MTLKKSEPIKKKSEPQENWKKNKQKIKNSHTEIS